MCPPGSPDVTFTRDVAPILFTACASCHRPEGIAPFSLLTYDEAKSHAAAIVAATRDRVMPPWKPEPGYGEFLDERRLTDDQIATLARWLEGGLVEGDRALLPRPPSWTGQWQLGTPDLVLETAPYTLRDVWRRCRIGTSCCRSTCPHRDTSGRGNFFPAPERSITPRCSSIRRARRDASTSRIPSRATKDWCRIRR